MSATAAIYRTSIAHVRRTPLKNAFTYRSYSWYVDVDRLPRLPRAAPAARRLRVADHLGDPDGTLRGNVERVPATRGIDARRRPDHHAGQRPGVRARLQPAEPVLVPRRRRRAALRHRRGPQHLRRTALLPPGNGRRRPGQRAQGVLRLPVQRRRRPVPDEAPGTRRTARRLDRPRARGAAALRRHHGRRTARGHRAGTSWPRRSPSRWRRCGVSAQIRWQGIKLWARRLPVIKRPHHPSQEAVQ